MRHFRIAAVSAAATAGAALMVAAAFGGTAARSAKTVPFSATFAGAAVVRAGGSSADLQATGTGTGTPIGKSKLAGKGLGKDAKPCPLFNGGGVITAADGSTIKFQINSLAKACPSAADEKKNAVSGSATFKGGTKKYAKAAGTFTFAGIYDRGTGKYSVKFTGKLTY